MKTPYDHTYMVIEDDIFEANYSGVVLVDKESWLKTHEMILEIEVVVSDLRYIELLEFIKEALGTPYGFWQLFRILMKWDYHDNGIDKYVCSELMARAFYIELGFNPEDELDSITPRDIYDRIMKLYHELQDGKIKGENNYSNISINSFITIS